MCWMAVLAQQRHGNKISMDDAVDQSGPEIYMMDVYRMTSFIHRNIEGRTYVVLL